MRACSALQDRAAEGPGTELAHYTGTAEFVQQISHQPYPWSPGYAAVGEVLGAGAEAGVLVGDLVLAHTPHQSAVRFDSRQHVCRPVPAGVAPRDATLARLGQVSAVGLRTSTAHAGDWAAVVGLGIVGACAVQLLRTAGLRVVGVETMPARRVLANRYGLPPGRADRAGILRCRLRRDCIQNKRAT
jgi:threonine dehydrogenase-like Zn-dependent dehydrogenase